MHNSQCTIEMGLVGLCFSFVISAKFWYLWQINLLKMKLHSIRAAVLFLVCAVCFGCQKKEQLYYTTLGTTPEKIDITDISRINDSTFYVIGIDKEDHTYVYLCRSKNQNSWSFSKRYKSLDRYRCIVFDDKGTTWWCGDKMFLSKSFDTLKTSQRHSKFTYWNEWPSEKTNLRELYVKDGRPYYMIGTDDLLSGSFYTYANSDTVYSSAKKHFGLNDMVVCGDDVYVAGYGSIFRVSGGAETLEDIGGENFTHICVGGSYLFACTYSGKIFRSEIGSNNWEKITSLGKNLLFIEANSKGDVIAAGGSREILVSTNYGTDWYEEKYSDGNKISCMKQYGDDFYIGTEKGIVVKITHNQLQINAK